MTGPHDGGGAVAFFALQLHRLHGTRHQSKDRPDPCARCWNGLFPLFPLLKGLFPLKVGTLLFNGDKDLQAFWALVPTVPTFFERPPEEKRTAKGQTGGAREALERSGRACFRLDGVGLDCLAIAWHPPIGTPGRRCHEGNSTPVAPVAADFL